MVNVKNENNILGRDIRMSLMKTTPLNYDEDYPTIDEDYPIKHVVRHRGFQAKAQELAADREIYKLTTTWGDRLSPCVIKSLSPHQCLQLKKVIEKSLPINHIGNIHSLDDVTLKAYLSSWFVRLYSQSFEIPGKKRKPLNHRPVTLLTGLFVFTNQPIILRNVQRGLWTCLHHWALLSCQLMGSMGALWGKKILRECCRPGSFRSNR